MATNNDDYNPQNLIAELSANLQQPDRFAQIFCEAAKKQKSIDEVLKEIIKSLMKNDTETQNYLKELIHEVNKEDWKFYLKKLGIGGWTLLVLVIGAILQALSTKFLGN